MLAVADGALLAMAGGEMIWAFYETYGTPGGPVGASASGRPELVDAHASGVKDAGAASSLSSSESPHCLSVRLSGQVLAHLPELFGPDEVLTLSYEAGTLRVIGAVAHVRTPAVAVRPPAAWDIAVANERQLATVDARALARALESRAGGFAASRRPGAPALRLDVPGEIASDVPASHLATALGAMPAPFATLSRADLVTRHDAVPVLAIRPAPASDSDARGGRPGHGPRSAWSDRTVYLVARADVRPGARE
jgi:hypothetical protein